MATVPVWYPALIMYIYTYKLFHITSENLRAIGLAGLDFFGCLLQPKTGAKSLPIALLARQILSPWWLSSSPSLLTVSGCAVAGAAASDESARQA